MSSARPTAPNEQRPGRPRRLVALLAAVVALFVVTAAPAAAQDQIVLKPGELVVSQQRIGQLVRIDADGKPSPIASGLEGPRGLLVLDDGSVLIAESTGNQISGLFGPYGSRPAPIATVTQPDTMAVGADGGTVFISSLSGAIFQLDVKTRAVVKFADNFARPLGLAVQAGWVYVADAGEQQVVRVSIADGRKELVADRLGAITGLVIGPDKAIYVADFTGSRILRITGDEPRVVSVFAGRASATPGAGDPGPNGVDSPAYLSLIPSVPRPGEPWSLAVSFKDGVKQFDSNGQPFGKQVTFPPSSAVGLSTVPGGPPVASPTTSRAPGSTLPGETPSSVSPVTTAPPTGGGGGANNNTTGLAVLGAVLLLLAGGGIAAYVLFSRRQTEDFEDDMEGWGTVDAGVHLSHAVGPCAAIEARLAEVDQAIRGIQDQRAAAERRRQEATTKAVSAKEREAKAREALAEVRAKLEAEGEAEKDAATPRISLDDLNLQTEEGWAALRAFGKKEISAVELRKRWESLGEREAISAVLGGGKAMKPAERAAAEELNAAKEERLHAERDAEEAAADLNRLDERETQVKRQRVEMKKALDECQSDQKADELQAATDLREVFAEAEDAATLAALQLRSEDFAAIFGDDASADAPKPDAPKPDAPKPPPPDAPKPDAPKPPAPKPDAP